MPSKFIVPGPTDRTTITGKTGSGKSQAGVFLLAYQAFDQMPWVILDFKREAMFREMVGIRELTLGKRDYQEFSQPGLFIVRPNIDQKEEVERFLWYVWEHEHIGLFVDEGYMIGNRSDAFVACLTQGRSKMIPMIILTQRPRWITQFAFSEADYLQIFRLNTSADRKTVQDFVDRDISERLPPYWSWWYDVANDTLIKLRPVPDRSAILGLINAKLASLQERQKQKQFV